MPKKKSIVSFQGHVNDVVEVASRAYGKHYRKPRGSQTPISINDAFQKSIELNNLANPVAKAIKDALDPFRKDFKDGTMWSRLVGILKKQLLKNPELDLSFLEKFQINKHSRIQNNYVVEVSVNVVNEPQPTARIELVSSGFNQIDHYKATSYEQTLIGIFLTADFKTTTCVQKMMLPAKAEMQYLKDPTSGEMVRQKHIATWPVPDGTKHILIAAKFEPYKGKNTINLTKLRALRVEKVVEVGKEMLPVNVN
ncbi:hypothetical protein BH09BAC3_BH09BAC3_03870 [soil metagenome]